ncbi:hypothetical protein D918_04922 [Trichuris suis]|nr:hypothetical protein D918_04922 [Trichuris suis]
MRPLSSSEEDEEETRPSKAKKIPSWANGDKLETRHAFQLQNSNPEVIFAGACPPLKAKEVFGRREEIKRNSESAIWEAD